LVSSLWNFSHARVTTKLIQLGTIVVCVCVSTHTNTKEKLCYSKMVASNDSWGIIFLNL
jgi:hypothetical protein